MLLKYFLLWFPMVIIAVINGTIRVAFLKDYLGELPAHQVSVFTGLILFGIYIMIVTRIWQIKSGAQALLIGFMWLCLTVAFEFVGGHYLFGNSWEKLFHDYNITQGRLWILILVWVTFAPYLFYKWKSYVE
ncbi:MAG: hypothetical protein M1391_08690 [Bacteroidetes bacterium]|nr:hypothetical protein [Bacteroidota bacterium]